jgi:hypothetical protein
MINPTELLGPAPCDDCRHRHHCGATGDACLSFKAFADLKPWRGKPKRPRADIGMKKEAA